MTTGTFAIVLTASVVAVPDLSTTTATRALPVTLTSSDNSLQSELDAIYGAQQQIIDHNSDYPFITDYDKTLLMPYIQQVALGNLLPVLGSINLQSNYSLADDYPIFADANTVDPSFTLNAFNADNQYYVPFYGDATRTITIVPHPGTEDMTFDVLQGNVITSNTVPLRAYDLSGFTPNSDGSYTIVVSPTEHSGNWIDTAGSTFVGIRDTMGDWGLPHNQITFDPTDGQPAFVPPVLSDSQIQTILADAPQYLLFSNTGTFNFGLQHAFNQIPDNTFTPIAPTIETKGGPLLPGQLSTHGHFSLEPNQALIVKVPDVDGATYTGFTTYNAWNAVPNLVSATGSLNNTQSFHDPDGFTYYVVSSKDPGVANWVNDSGLQDGNLWARFQGSDLHAPATSVTTQVVNVADVRQYLPADTPIVTPAERAAEDNGRLLDWVYRQDDLHNNVNWLTSELEYGQLRAAMGPDNFDKVFGTQPDVPSVMDRLTSPTLAPDMSTVFQDVMAHPTGALSAIVQNLPLLYGDIVWPEVLATLRMDYAAAGIGHMTFSTALSDTFTDPSSSIPAGFVNAYDDLATALMHSDSYSPLSSSDVTSALSSLDDLGKEASQAFMSGFSLLGDHAADVGSSVAAAAADLLP